MPVQLLPASVVLVVVLDRICFKALQLLRGVQWGLLPWTSQSLKQPQQQSFHSSSLDDHILVCPGHLDVPSIKISSSLCDNERCVGDVFMIG